ncbi:translocation protein TolB [Rubripirellula reticaptiva]|uniref:Translocation protein TolB n=2 Tax=Rubripirellula reticaptiva TaxID=2528013 RepID=A0A5C6EGR0_9BACT|nr:translocation protein TolB [Rubripirellula reticaptiva]
MDDAEGTERQLTSGTTNHILSNANVWSSDGQWIYYDVRSDAAGSEFDGTRIERIHVATGEVEVIYRSWHQACVGVVTANPVANEVVFIHGPENPTADWRYSASHRRGVIVRPSHRDAASNKATTVDARDLTPPFTPGALRGGSHVHTFSPDGKWIAFTYEDHVLASQGDVGAHQRNRRAIGISIPADNFAGGMVSVPKSHDRSHDGSHFSVVVTELHDHPRPGSDEICRAIEDAWIGIDGYVHSNGTCQRRAIAFQGEVVTENNSVIREVFVVDLPDDPTRTGKGPLEGTATTRPMPPAGVVQRRLTYTANHKFPGIEGPRHWLRSSPDGSQIVFLKRDDSGVVQLWTVNPSDGQTTMLTKNQHDIASAFTFSPNGRWISHVMDASVCVTNTETGDTKRLTSPSRDETTPRPEACVFSTDGQKIAYIRRLPVKTADGSLRSFNEIFLCHFTTH